MDTVSSSPTSPLPPKPAVMCFTVLYYISWIALLHSVSKEGAETFFSKISVQETLTEAFNQPAEKCFSVDGKKLSVEEWKDQFVAKFDSAYVNEIPGGKEWLGRRRGERGAGDVGGQG